MKNPVKDFDKVDNNRFYISKNPDDVKGNSIIQCWHSDFHTVHLNSIIHAEKHWMWKARDNVFQLEKIMEQMKKKFFSAEQLPNCGSWDCDKLDFTIPEHYCFGHRCKFDKACIRKFAVSIRTSNTKDTHIPHQKYDEKTYFTIETLTVNYVVTVVPGIHKIYVNQPISMMAVEHVHIQRGQVFLCHNATIHSKEKFGGQGMPPQAVKDALPKSLGKKLLTCQSKLLLVLLNFVQT